MKHRYIKILNRFKKANDTQKTLMYNALKTETEQLQNLMNEMLKLLGEGF